MSNVGWFFGCEKFWMILDSRCKKSKTFFVGVHHLHEV
jgi:hypothetical protein